MTDPRLRQLQTYNPVGDGSPEGVVDGPPGAVYRRTDGSPGTLLYVKTTGAGTLTGWSAFA